MAVFRTAVRTYHERKETMAMTILQINFKFDGSKHEYLEAFGEAAAPIAASPGLR